MRSPDLNLTFQVFIKLSREGTRTNFSYEFLNLINNLKISRHIVCGPSIVYVLGPRNVRREPAVLAPYRCAPCDCFLVSNPPLLTAAYSLHLQLLTVQILYIVSISCTCFPLMPLINICCSALIMAFYVFGGLELRV